MRTDDNGGVDIFSDSASRAGRYKRASNMMLYSFIAFLPFVVMAIMNGTFGIEAFLNPKALYYTPGLWERSGSDFWGAFLFETPFALMRGFSWSISLLLFLAFVFLTVKSWVIYKRAIKTDGNE